MLVEQSLVGCLRACWEPDVLPVAGSLAQQADLDWDAWLVRAEQETIGPLLYQLLRHRAIVPGRVEERLRREYFANSARSVLAMREVTTVVAAMAHAGVPVIVLKGAALALAIYGDIALRPMSDLDLLVHPTDVTWALDVLHDLGYALPLLEVTPDGMQAFSNELRLSTSQRSMLSVEIHWALFNSPLYLDKPSADWLWQTARPLRMGTVDTLMLGPEALLLHLCGHLAFHHGSQGLLWLHDIAEVLHHHDKLDWQVVLDQAQASDLVLSMQQVLPRVAADWHAPVPPHVLDTLATLRPSPAEARTLAWMHTATPGVALEVWSVLANLPGPRARLRYLADKLFPPPAYMRHRYAIPRSFLLPLYYPYRWLLGLRSAIRVAPAIVSTLRQPASHAPAALESATKDTRRTEKNP